MPATGATKPAPLAGRRVVVTRPGRQGFDLVAQLQALGAVVAHVPTIVHAPPTDDTPLRQAIGALASFDWVVFASANAVEAFMSHMPEEALHTEPAPVRPRFAAVGQATARALEAFHTRTDFVSEGTGRDLARTIPLDAHATVLLPQSNIALTDVAEALRQRGAIVHSVVAYTTGRDPDAAARVRTRAFDAADAIVFASPSAVTHGVAIATEEGVNLAALQRAGLRCVCIGPTTARAVQDHGLTVDAMAKRASNEALVRATAMALDGESRDG